MRQLNHASMSFQRKLDFRLAFMTDLVGSLQLNSLIIFGKQKLNLCIKDKCIQFISELGKHLTIRTLQSDIFLNLIYMCLCQRQNGH